MGEIAVKKRGLKLRGMVIVIPWKGENLRKKKLKGLEWQPVREGHSIRENGEWSPEGSELKDTETGQVS